MSTSGSDAYSMSADAMTQAGQGAQAAMGYKPMTVGGPGFGQAMQPFANPYTDQVVKTSQDALFDANQQALNATGYAAEQAGAFGGSRHGVAEAETNKAYLDANAAMSAGLYSQGFDTSANLAMQSQLANQAAGLQGAGLNLNAANSLAGIGNTGFGQANTLANQQAYYGAQQQAVNQALLDQSAAAWAGYAGAPATSIGMSPVPALYASAPTTTSTSQSYNPGLFDWLSMPLSM